MSGLKDKKCAACGEGTPPLKRMEILRLLEQLGNGWQVIEERRLEKEYRFKNFRDSLAFVNRIGEIAEAEGHHPDIFLSWGRVKVILFTHKINGLSESDFIMAAKCDS